MLATFVIALREGLEAALIVGIIAAFLRKNGKSLSAMWIGVTLAVLLSIVVGVVLNLTEHALPQARQELMESIIGFIAVFFVTGMVLWMNTHAHQLKTTLEREAAEAIGHSSTFALASMAFLAVLKEGFETSVFLLATFAVAQSTALSAAGAVLGLLVAVFIGWGIYIGGIRINLSRFFRFTGLFLILVAGGLIISSLRSAHEAGWLNIGQEKLLNLSWLVPPGTVQSAILNGILGIPSDPRLIEAIAWFIYILIVSLLVYWPAKQRLSTLSSAKLLLGFGVLFAAAALSLFFFYPKAQTDFPDTVPLVGNDGQTEIGQLKPTVEGDNSFSARIRVNNTESVVVKLAGDSANADGDANQGTRELHGRFSYTPSSALASMTLDQVMAVYGNRIPVGLNPTQHPGPYQAKWSATCSVDASVSGTAVTNAAGHADILITLSGSGLATPRTITPRSGSADPACDWQASDAYQSAIKQLLRDEHTSRDLAHFWSRIMPLFLAVMAITSLFSAQRRFKESSLEKQQLSSSRGFTTRL